MSGRDPFTLPNFEEQATPYSGGPELGSERGLTDDQLADWDPFQNEVEITPQTLTQLEKYRKEILKDPEEYYRFRDDPVGFNAVVLQGFLWSKQREICEAIKNHRLVTVPSCHDVGKSAIAARIIAWWICTNPPDDVFVVTLAPTWRQVRAILWREIGILHRKNGLIGRTTQLTWLIKDQLVGFGASPADHDPVALQGIHARRVLVVFDEACGVAHSLCTAASSLVANEDSRFLAIGNPDDPASYFAVVSKPGSGWHTIHIDAFDSPNFTGEPVPDWLRPLLISKTWVEERRKDWGESSPLWRSKVRGQFPEQGADTLISGFMMRRCMNFDIDEYPDDPAGPIEIGVDVARKGDDASPIYVRRGRRAHLFDQLRDRSTMVLAQAIKRAILTTGASAVKIDDNGVGGGVTDRLLEMQELKELPAPPYCTIYGINEGEPARTHKAAEKFANLRAELNWHLRTLIHAEDPADACYLPLDEDLYAQATGLKYEMDMRNRIKMESKQDMKDRGLPSPDKWDALVLCFAPTHMFTTPEWLKSKPLPANVVSIFGR